jgi:hypothetical protein
MERTDQTLLENYPNTSTRTMEEHNTILYQLEQIRRSGRTNMLDQKRVKEIAEEEEYKELSNVVNNSNWEEYVSLLKDMGAKRGESL